jgi:hypothetical protein
MSRRNGTPLGELVWISRRNMQYARGRHLRTPPFFLAGERKYLSHLSWLKTSAESNLATFSPAEMHERFDYRRASSSSRLEGDRTT